MGIKKNPQETNSETKEAGIRINNLEQKEKTFTWNRKKKQEFEENEERRRNLWDNFKHTNVWIWKEKRKSKTLKIYLKNNERKIPWFGEGKRHAHPGSTENPKQGGPKEESTS